jgi:rod shape determining protein RodA
MLDPSQRSRWRNADPFMLVTTLILIAFGLLTIYSADNRDLSPGSSAVIRQGLYTVVGLVLMATLAAVDYHFLQSLAVPIYALGLGLVALVLNPQVGSTDLERHTGARRWIEVGPLSFQPSEMAKIATIIALAAFIATRGVRMRSPLNYLLSGILAALPAVLVFVEPDLGTALIFLAIWAGIIFVSRTHWLYFLGTVLAAVPATVVAWFFVFQPYQKDRIYYFLHLKDDPLGHEFNVEQAMVTIGQAGLVGFRLAERAEVNDSQLLLVRTSDFAFAHATGNFGFIGAVALFVLFLLLIWRYLRVVHLARDEFGRLLAMGAASMLFFQAFVNIGMNVNLLPVVGIPLPFISVGGVAMVTFLSLQGILQSVLMHRHKLKFDSD